MTKRRKLKTVPKHSGGGIGGMGSGQSISAEQIKNQFFAHASSQRAGKESGDAGYWQGGRCNWGGSHNLAEDSQALADFANSTASIENDAQELTLAINEQEFNNKKQLLVNKLQDCINKCNTSDSYSVASVCCIWNDFFGTFLKPFLNGLQQKMQSQLNQLQNVEPKHQKEILEIEAEIKAAEAKYQENITKANTETDPAKKAKLILLAQEAETELKKAKQKLTRNPLSKLAQYSYLYDIGRLIGGNINHEPVNLPSDNPSPDPDGSSGGSGRPTNPDGQQNPWTSWGGGSGNTNNQQSANQQQLLIFAVIAVLVIFFLMNQQKDYD
jgi:hypothetical protein